MKGPLARMCSFATETEMSESLEQLIAPYMSFNQLVLKREFKGPQGVPDFLLFRKCDSSVVYAVSLELKLRDWKKGLYQAFKYRSYTNAAYVIVDRFYQDDALSNLQLFIDSNIGLASFSLNRELQVIFEPNPDMPFSTYYSQLLKQKLASQGVSKALNSRFTRSTFGKVKLESLTTAV